MKVFTAPKYACRAFHTDDSLGTLTPYGGSSRCLTRTQSGHPVHMKLSGCSGTAQQKAGAITNHKKGQTSPLFMIYFAPACYLSTACNI